MPVDNWQPKQSRTQRTATAQRSMIPGTLDGRVRQASPIPQRPDIEQTPITGGDVWVAPTAEPPPDIYDGRLWFVTDEPIPGA